VRAADRPNIIRRVLELACKKGRALRTARVVASVAALALAPAAAAPAARAEDPNALERIVSLKRSPDGASAHLLDTPVLQVVRAREERYEGGQREQVRIASSPLFSVYRRDSSTAAAGAVSRTHNEGRFASVLGVSLLSWSSEQERGMAGATRTDEREVRFLSLPKLGSLFARKTSKAGSSYEVLYFLHFGAHEPEGQGPPEDAPEAE
jgi:hypothetical protein